MLPKEAIKTNCRHIVEEKSYSLLDVAEDFLLDKNLVQEKLAWVFLIFVTVCFLVHIISYFLR